MSLYMIINSILYYIIVQQYVLHIMINNSYLTPNLLPICLSSLAAMLTLVKLFPTLPPAQLQGFHRLLISLAPPFLSPSASVTDSFLGCPLP